jgi:hypothetical protein
MPGAGSGSPRIWLASRSRLDTDQLTPPARAGHAQALPSSRQCDQLRICLIKLLPLINNMLFLLFVIISDPVEMSALRPRFLPTDVPVRWPSLAGPQSSPLADLLVHVDAHGKLPRNGSRLSLGR